jgi:hypothetical protein
MVILQASITILLMAILHLKDDEKTKRKVSEQLLPENCFLVNPSQAQDQDYIQNSRSRGLIDFYPTNLTFPIQPKIDKPIVS